MMLTRGMLAKKAGCNSETIRYYEKIGILPTPKRADNGYRIYDDENLKRLQFIQRARELGFSTDSVKNLLLVTDDSARYTRAEVKALTENHIGDITKKIKDLNAIRKTLTDLSKRCDGASESAEHCPIINSIRKR